MRVGEGAVALTSQFQKGVIEMLVLSRMNGESINIGDDIVITVSKIRGNTVRIGIDAPKNVKIVRTEIAGRIVETNATECVEKKHLSEAS